MYTETQTTRAIPFNYQVIRQVNYSFLNFDLRELIGILKNDQKWKKGEMNMMILRKNPVKRIILAVLHEKTQIKSVQINDSITIQVIEGHLKLHFKKESVDLLNGETITLDEKTKYKINSIDETAFILTLVS
jgi:phage terminase large subunit